MGDVVDIRTKAKQARPTEAQKILLLKRVMRVAAKYIKYADHRGVYRGFEIDGKAIAQFLEELQEL